LSPAANEQLASSSSSKGLWRFLFSLLIFEIYFNSKNLKLGKNDHLCKCLDSIGGSFPSISVRGEQTCWDADFLLVDRVCSNAAMDLLKQKQSIWRSSSIFSSPHHSI
jgi:hypothetical protein